MLSGEAYELLKDGKKVTAHQLGNPKEWYRRFCSSLSG